VNIHFELYIAATISGEVCAKTYEALHTTYTLAGMYDLIEMKQVQDSWRQAAMLNAQG